MIDSPVYPECATCCTPIGTGRPGRERLTTGSRVRWDGTPRHTGACDASLPLKPVSWAPPCEDGALSERRPRAASTDVRENLSGDPTRSLPRAHDSAHRHLPA